jgi:hypothetical protein
LGRTFTYPTIKSVGSTSRGPGASDTANLQSMFSEAPGLSLDAQTYKESALKLLQDGAVEENLQVGSYSRDFSGAPNYNDVPVGAGGLPASPWTPNPVSPGEGSVNPSDMAAAPEGYGTVATNGSHAGASTVVTADGRNPAVSSTNMSERVTPSNLGQSPATQNAS